MWEYGPDTGFSYTAPHNEEGKEQKTEEGGCVRLGHTCDKQEGVRNRHH